ncbi:lipase 1-like [Malaya genurostris]|uniref:lipase 1-like n=1 Tax=Malaya genurostris TaxID=325434 RepID=UPI0026F3F3F5|nr:lipase 1-like [Malaya genurostris]
MTRSGLIAEAGLLVLSVIVNICSAANELYDTEHYITKYGINASRYRATTADGYKLALFRLRPAGEVLGVALLQHGNRETSADWLRHSSNLPSQLLTAGIEVWLANSRLSPESWPAGRNTSAEFWDFSFHEIGIYDLATTVDVALNISARQQIHVIGFSEGSTAALVLLSERPEYNGRVASLNLMAPAAYMARSKFKAIAQTAEIVRIFAPKYYETLHDNNYVRGSSRKQLEHYGQLIISGRFRQYNYGSQLNLKHYGSKLAPDYRLWQITIPVALHYGCLDVTVNPTDVEQLGKVLSKNTSVRFFRYDALDHQDFTARSEASKLVYPNIVNDIRSFNQSNQSVL